MFVKKSALLMIFLANLTVKFTHKIIFSALLTIKLSHLNVFLALLTIQLAHLIIFLALRAIKLADLVVFCANKRVELSRKIVWLADFIAKMDCFSAKGEKKFMILLRKWWKFANFYRKFVETTKEHEITRKVKYIFVWFRVFSWFIIA